MVLIIFAFILNLSPTLGHAQANTSVVDTTKSELDSLSKTVKNIDIGRNTLQSQIQQLQVTLDKQNSRVHFLGNIFWTIITGIISGIIAWILTLLWTASIQRRKFEYLSGKWIHLDRTQKPISESFSKIKYAGGGKLEVFSNTKHGKWNGRIVMDDDMPNYGGGMFQYEEKNESGLLQFIVQSQDLIHVAPTTITHDTQKTNFYILKRDTKIAV